MKKCLTMLFVALMLSCALFAKGAPEQKAEGPVDLKFWSLFTGGDGEFFDAMIDAFNASQDKIVATNDMVKFSDYYTKLTTALAAKTAPDVVVVHQANLLKYVEDGALFPLNDYLTEEITDDFFSAPLEACRFDGSLYALPLDVHPIVMYYNKDILEKAGITELPQTAEDIVKDCLLIKEKTDKTPIAIDNTTGTYKAFTLTRLFFSMMYQQGGSFLNEDRTKVAFNNEMGEKALSWMQDLVHKYGVNPNELDYDAAMNMFKLGEVGFYFNGVWATGTLEQTEGLRFGACPLPPIMGGNAAWAGSHTLAVPVQKQQDPKKVQAAIEFINWMTSHGEMWAKAGHIPTRKSVQAKDEFKALPYRADYAGASAFALETPRSAAWEEVYQTSSDLLENAVRKNIDTKQALADMEKTLNDIIATY